MEWTIGLTFFVLKIFHLQLGPQWSFAEKVEDFWHLNLPIRLPNKTTCIHDNLPTWQTSMIGVSLSEPHTSESNGGVFIYRSLEKDCPWVEHLTSLPKWGLSALLSVSTFNHERAPMYAYSNSLPTNSLNYWTNDNVQWGRRPWKLTS